VEARTNTRPMLSDLLRESGGPVGTCKLLFEPQFTRFRNLAV
jgi:replicative DNA helicase